MADENAVTTESIEETLDAGGELSEDQLIAMVDGDVPVPELEDGNESGKSSEPNGDQPENNKETGDQDGEDPSGDGDDNAEDEKPEKVIIAKDGEHTIPYEQLVEARETAKEAKETATEWRDIAEEKDRIIAELKKEGGEGPGQDQQEAEDKFAELHGMTDEEYLEFKEDYPAAAKMFESMLEKVSTLEQAAAGNAHQDHLSKIQQAHPDAGEIAGSEEFTEWIDSQPSFLKSRYEEVFQNGTTEEVIEMLDVYKDATGGDTTGKEKSGSNENKVADTKAKAEERVKAVKEKQSAPSSLGDIPGSNAHHDEGEAMREMSATGLLDKFEGKTMEQIEALLEKAL